MRLVAIAVLAACSFDASTPGATGPSSVGRGSSTGEPGSTSMASTSSTPESSEASTADASTSAPAPGSTSTDTDSTGAIDCSGDTIVVADFLPTNVTHPMTSGWMPDPVGTYAYSPEANLGTVAFELELPCAGEYAIWGLVYDEDRDPFDDGGNADSFLVSVDDGPLLEWSYGCSTLHQLDDWSYERVRVAAVLDCGVSEDVVFPLAAGPHIVSFRNVEAGEHGEGEPGSVAAIARIAVTDIEGYTPDPDLD